MRAVLEQVPVGRYCEHAGVPEEQVRNAARRIARASCVAVAEDLGVQMNRHSTLVSYLEKLLWSLTGNFGRPGAQYLPSTLAGLGRDRGRPMAEVRRSPVVGAPIISGLVPCNVIADEILTDHPARYRAMIVESSNPVHSLAGSARMRAAFEALDLVVVIDVAMTETARLAHYVLPAPTQYEKYEASFFNFEFPRNVFHLRRPVVTAPEGVLPEPEIHARLVEAAGALGEADYAPLRQAAAEGRAAFAAAFTAAVASDPRMSKLAPVLLYRTLGPTLPDGAAAAAVLWGMAHGLAASSPGGVRRAGYGEGPEAGERLFAAILSGEHGVVVTDDEQEASFARLKGGKVRLEIPELLAELAALPDAEPPAPDPRWPYVLAAGQRRPFTANTIMRDPAWRLRDTAGALRMSEADAERLGVRTGDRVRVSTRTGSAEVTVETTDRMRSGHLALPNGYGLSVPGPDGTLVTTGVAPNELTSAEDRDPWTGTPWHKYVPARGDPVPG